MIDCSKTENYLAEKKRMTRNSFEKYFDSGVFHKEN